MTQTLTLDLDPDELARIARERMAVEPRPKARLPHCDMCAGPLPWKPYRGIAYHRAVTCCTPACLTRLADVWAPAPRAPWIVRPLVMATALLRKIAFLS